MLGQLPGRQLPRQTRSFQDNSKNTLRLFHGYSKTTLWFHQVNYDLILFNCSGSTSTFVDIFLMPSWSFSQTTHQPQTEDLTQAWLLNVFTSELLKGSFNPVLFELPHLKPLQVNIKITTKINLRISSIQGNLVLLSLALLDLSLLFIVLSDSTKKTLGNRGSCGVTFENLEFFRV